MLNKITCFSKIGKLGKFSFKNSKECPYEKNRTKPMDTINPDFVVFFNNKFSKNQISTVVANTNKIGKIISFGETLTFCENRKIIGNIENMNG